MEDKSYYLQCMRGNEDLRKQIDQRKPFPSEQSELVIGMLFTLDRVLETAHAPLRSHDLSGEQYNVLRILRGAGPEGMATYTVVRRMVSRAPNITRLVDKLQQKGLLRRSRSDVDRRVTTLRITDEGLRLLGELDEPTEESTVRAMRGLDGEEREALQTLLRKIREPLDGGPVEDGPRDRENE